MYGDIANKLVQEAKRTKSLDTLPLFKDDYVKDIIRETVDLQQEAEILAAQQDDIDIESNRVKNCQLFITHLCMRRNKRCLLAYQKLRASKLDQLAWEDCDPSRNLFDNLSHHEQEYFRKYSEIIADYKGPLTDVDLSGSLEPPSDIFIDVRVLKDAGEIQTEYGVYNLTKDSQFFVRQADVQRLIQQGYLEKISS